LRLDPLRPSKSRMSDRPVTGENRDVRRDITLCPTHIGQWTRCGWDGLAVTGKTGEEKGKRWQA